MSEAFVNAGEAPYPFGNAEPFVELGFNDGIDLATPAGLLNGEFAAALVPMPEAAVHEDACAVFGQHDVWCHAVRHGSISVDYLSC